MAKNKHELACSLYSVLAAWLKIRPMYRILFIKVSNHYSKLFNEIKDINFPYLKYMNIWGNNI